MRYAEVITLKIGDLVVVDNRNKRCGGLVLEVVSINTKNYLVTLKQPGFDSDFIIVDYDARHLKRYAP